MGALDVARRQARWEGILADPAQIALVAQVDGALAGFGLAGPPGDTAFGDRGEVLSLIHI